MPYLTEERKNVINQGLVRPSKPGDLNYLFTKLCTEYTAECGLSYQTINDIVRALESCKLEFYRRVAADYENKKISLNGDVY